MKIEESPSHLALGIAISLIAYVFFISASTLVASFAGAFSTVQIIFIQNIVSFFCILPLTFTEKFPGYKTQILPIHLIRDICGVVSYYLYFVAIRYLDLVDATILNYTAPFFVPLFWWAWMKERVGRNVWWSIIVGFIGTAVILNPSKQIFQLGFIFGLFAGIASAIAFCAIRILSLKREPTRRTLLYYFSIGSILSLPFALVYWIPPTPVQWIKAIAIGLLTACGQILLNIAYRYGTASYLSPLGYSTVIYAGLISYFILGHPIGWRTVVGTLLIICGGTVTYLLKKKPQSLAETFQSPNPKEKPPL